MSVVVHVTRTISTLGAWSPKRDGFGRARPASGLAAQLPEGLPGTDHNSCRYLSRGKQAAVNLELHRRIVVFARAPSRHERSARSVADRRLPEGGHCAGETRTAKRDIAAW